MERAEDMPLKGTVWIKETKETAGEEETMRKPSEWEVVRGR